MAAITGHVQPQTDYWLMKRGIFAWFTVVGPSLGWGIREIITYFFGVNFTGEGQIFPTGRS